MVNTSRQASRRNLEELDNLAISEVNSENSLDSEDDDKVSMNDSSFTHSNSPVKNQVTFNIPNSASPRLPIQGLNNLGSKKNLSNQNSSRRMKPTMSMSEVFTGLG